MAREKIVQNEIFREFGTRPDMRIIRQNVGVGVPYSVVKSAAELIKSGQHDRALRVLSGARPIHFGIPGQADITGILKGGTRLEIEVKGERGKQSREQKNYQNMIEKYGGLYILARDTSDVKRRVNEILSH